MGFCLSSYPDSVRFLYALGNETRAVKFGLERVSTLLDHLGSPHRACRFVHVAGTNGKGSVCALVESALRAAGLRTGLFTSPHLVEPTERIRICGDPVSPERFAGAFVTVHAQAERLLAQGRLDAHPTYFEMVTAMAFLLFRELAAETVVLEVGLGGRLDATNVVSPQLTVITPIDYDHEGHLGTALETIAGEKAGIIKPGVPLVTGPQRPEVQALLEARAKAAGAPVTRWSRHTAEDLLLTPRGSRFTIAGPPRLRIECPLAGEHQVANALTAVAALELLPAPPAAIEEGVRTTRWPARLECVSEEPEIILDGAHNPAGARVLADHIRRFYSGRRVRLVFGAMRDKALAEMAGILFPLAEEVILTAPDHPRAVRPELIHGLADHPKVRLAPSLPAAIQSLREPPPGDVAFVTGSLYLAGAARAMLVQ
ncbi:MAG: bifunctional folylpolyglutamate synthase/dihydrofolate synthase [Bryobacterales bacterium]|nr:bifunctional folylpolyglutamate synthase/dihydrofolate synthase [Bryobacterales bacterium]